MQKKSDNDSMQKKKKSLQISWKYTILIFLKGFHDLICKQNKN